MRAINTVLLTCFLLYSGNSIAAVLVKNKMWPKNTQLNVLFLDGNEQQHALVKRYAPEWLKGTSLTFNFYTDEKTAPAETHIRVSFKTSTGSKLGNHGDYLSREPTLQLSKLSEPELIEDYAKRWILHEFGHALGFEHEYRNPHWPYGNAPIDKEIKTCIPQMMRLQFSEKQAKTKCHDINHVLDKNSTNSTVYDELSIMNYPMNIKLNGQSTKIISAHSQLSILDKLAMERWYSK